MEADQQPGAEEGRAPRAWGLLTGLAVLLLVLASYGTTLGGAYLGDDYPLIFHSADREGRPNLARAGRQFVEPVTDGASRFYRPIWWASFTLDVALGAEPLASRSIELGLHVASAILLALLLLELGAGARAAALSALLFAVFPTAPEAVTWVAGRTDLLVATFGLGLLFAAARARRAKLAGRSPLGWRALELASAALALGSKESAVALAPVLFLVELHLARRGEVERWTSAAAIALKRTLWLAPLFLFYAWWRKEMIGDWVGGYSFMAKEREWSWLVHVKAGTLSSLAWPLASPLFAWLPALARPIAAALAVAAGVLCLRRGKRPLAGLLLAWLLFAYLPNWRLEAPSPDRVGTRMFYLLCLPWCPLLVLLVDGALESLRAPRIARAVALALLVTGALVTLRARLAPYARAGETMNAVLADARRLTAESGGSPLLLWNVPDSMGPSVVARNALQQRVWLRPPFEEPGLAGGVTALLDVDVRPGRFPEWGLAVLAVRGPLRSFRWDGEAQRFEPAGWPWEELTLRGVLRELGPGELAVGDVRLRASWSPGALDRARGAFAQVRLAPAAAPADGDGDGDDGRTWRVRDAVPAQPLLVREDSGSWRLAASAPRGVGLLLVSRERALEPFAVGGALLLDAPTVLTLAPDPSGGLYLPDAVLRDWRGGFAQVLLSTPGGPVLSERVGL